MTGRTNSVHFRIAQSDDDIARCFAVMIQLRPRLEKRTFVPLIRSMMREGYQLAYLEDQKRVQAVAGFRITTMLARGRHMYVDDLVTNDAHRSRGYGGQLLGWLAEQARAAGCQEIDLDSGVQRHAAHRFYFRHGMEIMSFHFRRML